MSGTLPAFACSYILLYTDKDSSGPMGAGGPGPLTPVKTSQKKMVAARGRNFCLSSPPGQISGSVTG